MKTLRSIISSIISFILIAFLVLVMFIAISSRITGNAPQFKGYELLMVLSGSMEPKIHTGSVILVKKIDSEKDKMNFKKGDVVTYQSPQDKNKIITHRIFAVKGTGPNVTYTTKGDANDAPDGWAVLPSNVVGVYENFTIPYVGYIVNFAKSKVGIALLFIIPGAILIIAQIISMWRAISKAQKENAESKVM